MKLFIIRAISFFILFTLYGCKTVETRGQFIDDNLLKKLESSQFKKQEVEELIGTPTIIPEYSRNTWYYVERTMTQRAWFSPKVLEQRIIKIIFNKNNIIQEVIIINDTHNEEVQIIKDYTKTYGTELNSLQKFVKNIGKFNQTTTAKKKKKK